MNGAWLVIWGILAFIGFLGIGMARTPKTGPSQVGNHPLRQGIVNRLRRRPGLNMKELAEELACNRGTLTHHLYLLERSGIVASTKTRTKGRSRHFFLAKENEPLRQRITLLRQQRALDIVLAVRHWQGAFQSELTKSLGMTRKTFRAWVDSLVAEGLLREDRRGRHLSYSVTPELDDALRLSGHEPLPLASQGTELPEAPQSKERTSDWPS